MSMTFRFADVPDAPEFAEWAANNSQIPAKDIEAGKKENNPTATVLVIEEDGKPILFVPLYCAIRIAYLGFNPQAGAPQRMQAMEMMLLAIKAFATNFGINEVDVLTKAKYPVARWARKHDFKPDDRELFALTVGLEKKESV